MVSVVWKHVGTTRGERARREVSVSNIIADVCVPTALLGNSCCVRVVCWAVGGAPSRVRALRRGGGVSCGAAPRAVGSHFPPRWYVAHAFRAQAVAMHPWRQRGGTAWAASRVPRGWAAGRRRTSWPALPSRHRCGRATRAASGGHWEATGPPAEARPRAARPRGAVSVPAFRRPARVRTRVACNIGTELWYHRVELR